MKQKLLLLLLGVLSVLPALSRDFEYKYEGKTITYTVIDEEAKTCKTKDGTRFACANGVSGDLILPANPKDEVLNIEYSLTTIGYHSFFEDLPTTVKIPDSVTTIEDGAFCGCWQMTSIDIPNSVTYIGENAFSGCRVLKSIHLPDALTSIGYDAFYGCKGLVSVVIPNSVTEIGEKAFYDCSGLTSVVIGNSVKTIRKEAFYGCNGLTSVVIGNSVMTIGSNAFNECNDMIKFAYPNTLKTPFDKGRAVAYNPEGAIIEDGFVYGPDKSAIYFAPLSLKGKYTLPESVTSIGEYAFYCCSSLTSVEIGNSVQTIGQYAFHGCSGLTSLLIGNSVQTIGDYAFYECRGLTSIEIPNSVTSIGKSAFGRCFGLISLTFNAENCEAFEIREFESISVFPTTIKHLVIGNEVKKIPAYFFYNIYRGQLDPYDLTSVVIPNSVTEIGESAFESCNLDTIIMGYGVETIGNYAFNGVASKIYITAQTPPEIQSRTFSNYKGMLYLQGRAAVNAYDDDKYWGNFNNELMTVPTALEIEGLTSISGNAGDTFQLKAKMTPEDVTLPYILWRSTNPKIATVDKNGLMELQEYSAEDLTRAEGDEDNDGTCKIIAESLYFDGPIAEITVNNTGISGVEAVIDRNDNSIDYSQPYNVYNMNGFKVAETTEGLTKGIYIIRQGKAAVKTVVK